ncbi:hypothetical protein QFZ37_001979 [Chryseobacterium ginsenosidimutans]|uniref:DUF6985 domain-containing protein n=1 Tax=Chryseobacterium ginsenosidimutans TaxID=687846 RepID=UPI0027835936|nr:hypothetical protein [Chryseobacterium ginsenosidimutans]MDQ0593610.1 hypothetical protein [Chryseobacterium ginsenosidimutans]
MKHSYWGNIEADWAGFSSDLTFSNPFFDEQEIEIFLGVEYDEDGEEIEELPTENQLTEFAETYRDFLENIETNIKSIQDKAYERYLKVYAHFYENSEKSGEKALNIDNVDKHNENIKEIMYLRVLNEKTIKLFIRYKLDREHGLEFKFVDGQIEDVGGVAET